MHGCIRLLGSWLFASAISYHSVKVMYLFTVVENV